MAFSTLLPASPRRSAIDYDVDRDSFLSQHGNEEQPDLPCITHQASMRRIVPPLHMEDALLALVGIRSSKYFIAAVDETGSHPLTTIIAGSELSDAGVLYFFNTNKFEKVMLVSGADSNYRIHTDDYERAKSLDQPSVGSHPAIPLTSPPTHSTWTRLNPLSESTAASQMTGMVESRSNGKSSRIMIPLRDEQAIWSFYTKRFLGCQQAACKLIAKAWIKLLEPRKQSIYPYTGREEKAPLWWPKPWGSARTERVRHREPDHLYKQERVHLLVHILRLVVTPTNRTAYPVNPAVSVTMLEKAAFGVLAPDFPTNEVHKQKRTNLNEIFQLAKQEEILKKDGTDTSVPCMVRSSWLDQTDPCTTLSSADSGSSVDKVTSFETLGDDDASQSMSTSFSAPLSFVDGVFNFNDTRIATPYTSMGSGSVSPGMHLQQDMVQYWP